MKSADLLALEKHEAEETFFSTYSRILTYLKPVWLPFLISTGGFAFFAASQPMLAKLIEVIITAIEQKDSDARWMLAAAAIGIFAVRGAGSFLGTYYNAYVSSYITRSVKIQLFNHMTTLPSAFFDQSKQGALIHRINAGVSMIQGAISDPLKTIIREGLTFIFLLGYVFYLNWRLSLAFIAVAPFMLLIVSYTNKRLTNLGKREEALMGGASQVTKEMVSSHTIMRAFGAADYEKKRFSVAVESIFKRQMSARKIIALATPTMQLLVSVAIAIVVFLLLLPTTLAANSTGELIGYLTAVALLPKPLRQLSGVGIPLQRGVLGARMVFALLDTKPEVDTGTVVVERVKGDVEFRDVSFKYETSDSLILDHISLKINAGEMVALVGKSGSGKSTLVSLLYRLYDVDDGQILIDQIPHTDYTLASLRRQISVVSQNVILFDDTIRNNIAYGSSDTFSDEDILQAAKNAHALEFIEKLPKGLNTLIGDSGLMLSGGQRQRLAIARAFLKNAPILILDEATSALDNQSEGVIKEALETITKNRTTIVIAHRLSTIEKADRLLVMEDGKILEEGTHKQLLNKGGHYSKLYHAEYKKT